MPIEERNDQPASLTVEGTVSEALPHAMYAVTLDGGQRIIGHLPGMTQAHLIRVVPGDRVRLELSPFDRSRGRIVARLR